MITLVMALRGLRSRWLLSVGTLALMVLAVGGSVLGPSFQQASTTAYTQSRLAEAADPLTALTWELEVGPHQTLDELVAAGLAEVERILPVGYSAPELTLTTPPIPEFWRYTEWTYAAREGACDQLEVHGACPSAPGEVLVNEKDVTLYPVGEEIRLPALGRQLVVGTYTTPESDEHWLFPARMSSRGTSPDGIYRPGPIVLTPEAFGTLPPGQWLPLVDSRLRLTEDLTDAEFDALVQDVEALTDRAIPLETGGVVNGEAHVNELDAVLDDVQAQRSAASDAVAPAVLSLVLVALAMILRLQAAAADLRASELALASLRGVGRRQAWLLGLAEPWLLVVASAPLGVLLGYGASTLLAAAWLPDGIAISLPAASLVSAGLVAVAIAVVVALAIGKVLREQLRGQLSGVRRPGESGRLALVAELGVVFLALALPLGKLGAGGEQQLDVTDLLLPVVTAIAVGLVVTRATGALARWRTRRGAERPMSVFVGLRAVARRSQGTLLILPISAAIALSVFALGLDSVAAGWRASVADTRAPADVVYSSPLSVSQTLQLTREVDPDGEWLMATADVVVPELGRIGLVDSARLERVVHWQEQWTGGRGGGEIADRLEPAYPFPHLTGTRLALTATSSSPGTGVELEVLATEGGRRTIDLGPFGPQTATQETGFRDCRLGCDLIGITVEDAPVGTEVEIAGLTVDGEPVLAALDAAGWSPDGAEASDDGDSLTLVGESSEGTVRWRGLEGLVPAVVGVDSWSVTQGEDGPEIAFTYETVPLEVVATAESLPTVGPTGVVLDLPTFLNRFRPGESLTDPFVLARDEAPAEVTDALAEAGLTVEARADDTREALDQSAYAQALRLYLVVAAAMLTIALGGLLVGIAVQLPARRRDAASMRVVGVSRRSLVGSALWEWTIVLGASLVAGLVAGAAAQAVLLPSLTLGLDDPTTPPVLPEPDVQRIVLLALAVTLVLATVAVAASTAVVRGARAATLREAAT